MRTKVNTIHGGLGLELAFLQIKQGLKREVRLKRNVFFILGLFLDMDLNE